MATEVATEEIIVVATEVATEEIIVVATEVVTEEIIAVAIQILTQTILINPLEQKDGRIGVMETHLKIQNTKVVEVGEKEEFQTKVISLKKTVRNPYPQVLLFV